MIIPVEKIQRLRLVFSPLRLFLNINFARADTVARSFASTAIYILLLLANGVTFSTTGDSYFGFARIGSFGEIGFFFAFFGRSGWSAAADDDDDDAT